MVFMSRTQAERSAATQARLLEAALACLVERGYHGTSTAAVCRRAGVTRGAQLHHYPTKAALLAAAVEHVFTVRHEELRARLAAGPLGLEALVDHLWEIYSGPTLAAWQELVVASRTDAALRRVVKRVDARFTADAEVTFRSMFKLPAGVDVAAATRVVLALFDGLALANVVVRDAPLARRALTELRRLLAPWLAGAQKKRRTR
jgi:AcrR family transcriptional regulator